VKPEEDIKEVARGVFDTALENAGYSGTGDPLVYGNSRGRGILEQLDDLQSQVDVLKVCSDGYLRIRQRFLDTFRRDILKNPNVRGSSHIQTGNMAAHGGNAVIDARIFKRGARGDLDLMEIIYGLDHDDVLSLGKY
jgi:hypothetical protein